VVRVVDGDPDLVAAETVAVGDDLVVADERPGVRRPPADEPDHGESAGIDGSADRRPVPVEDEIGEGADAEAPQGGREQRLWPGWRFWPGWRLALRSQLEPGSRLRPASRLEPGSRRSIRPDRPEPEGEGEPAPVEGLDLAVDEPAEAGRVDRRRLSVLGREDARRPAVADDEGHAAAEPLTRVADAEPARVEGSEAKRRSGRPGVREVEAVKRGSKVADADARHARHGTAIGAVRRELSGPGNTWAAARALEWAPRAMPTNRLANETSPYLLQHAHNPVDWYPWGEEAFARAKAEDKPIFLSIGYAACHWCHVMERESFEDPATAEQLNRDFVAIKVDREERPDVDQVYMAAVQAMTGGGGWPMSVFLTPDGKPFYGGTYFPPEPRHGLPSFRQVLAGVRRAWDEQRAEVEQAGTRLVAALIERGRVEAGTGLPNRTTLDAAVDTLERSFDPRAGGWGGAPKFPAPMTIEFLLRRAAAGPELDADGIADRRALAMARWTLDRMADGGIFDQLGGGFHRYAVDAVWLVPHFEKMLYDNAQLARVYLHAWQLTREPRYLEVATATLDYPGRARGAGRPLSTGGRRGGGGRPRSAARARRATPSLLEGRAGHGPGRPRGLHPPRRRPPRPLRGDLRRALVRRRPGTRRGRPGALRGPGGRLLRRGRRSRRPRPPAPRAPGRGDPVGQRHGGDGPPPPRRPDR
jgi:hypothetical protein